MLQVFQLCCCCCCCSLTLFLCRDIYGMSQEERLRCKYFSCDVVLLDSFCVEISMVCLGRSVFAASLSAVTLFS